MSTPKTEASSAHIEVTPNPAMAGQEVTITGHCGAAGELRSIFTPNGKPFVGPVQIVNPDPTGFEATATIDENVGAGAGSVYLDCGSHYGETRLVTQPSSCQASGLMT